MKTPDDLGILEVKYANGRTSHVRWDSPTSPEVDVSGATSVQVLQLPSGSEGMRTFRAPGLIVHIGFQDESGKDLSMEVRVLTTQTSPSHARLVESVAEAFAKGLEHLAASLRAGVAVLPVQRID